jgi:hypothetical protein
VVFETFSARHPRSLQSDRWSKHLPAVLSQQTIAQAFVGRTVSHVLIPLSNAYFSNGKAASSSMTHPCHLDDPNPAHPRIIFDISRPESPSLRHNGINVLDQCYKVGTAHRVYSILNWRTIASTIATRISKPDSCLYVFKHLCGTKFKWCVPTCLDFVIIHSKEEVSEFLRSTKWTMQTGPSGFLG